MQAPTVIKGPLGRAESRVFETDHRMTHYKVTAFRTQTSVYVLVDRFNNGNGTYMKLPVGEEVAWSYLAEKLNLRDGDREGLSILISEAIGERVF